MEKSLNFRVFRIMDKYGGSNFLFYANENGVIEIANRAAVFQSGIIKTLKKAIDLLEKEGYDVEEISGMEWLEVDLTNAKIYGNYVFFKQGV